MLRQPWLSLCWLVVLCGCTSIPLTSVPKLAALDPQTLNLSDTALAVRVDEDFLVYADGATINMLVEGGELNAPMELVLQLEPSRDPLPPYLRRQEKSGSRIAVFEVADTDKARIEAFRNEILTLRQNAEYEGAYTSTIRARATGCFRPGANPFRDFRMKLYLRPTPGDEFFTLFKETRLQLEKDEEGRSAYCSEEQQERVLG